MKNRGLGGSGATVSAIGLGCMGMSIAYGPADPAETQRTLDRAAELGITFLDTADAYGQGANEELLGGLAARAGARELLPRHEVRAAARPGQRTGGPGRQLAGAREEGL